jgi:hypothetical protein
VKDVIVSWVMVICTAALTALNYKFGDRMDSFLGQGFRNAEPDWSRRFRQTGSVVVLAFFTVVMTIQAIRISF